jgi:hypothetical protein
MMNRSGICLALVATVALSSSAHAIASIGRPKAPEPTRAQKVKRGAVRAGMFVGGLAMVVGGKSAVVAGDAPRGGALAAAGLNLVIHAFSKDPTVHMGRALGLTTTAAVGGWLLGDFGQNAGLLAAGAVLAGGPTIGNFISTATSHE